MAQEPSASGTPAVMTVDSTEPKAGDAKSERHDLASKLVDRFAIWAGVAGILPLPILDLFAVGGLQVQMLRRLSQIYDVPFSANRGKSLIATLAGSMIPASSAIGAASLLKSIPVLGTVAASVVMAPLSAGATYAIGKAFIQHFASGGTLLNFNPPDYREFLKAHKEMWDKRMKRPGEAAKADAAANADAAEAAAAKS